MKFFSLVKHELLERKHQLMTSLTAITLGIAAIVGIQTIARHSEIEVAYQVDSLGSNIVVLPKSASVENYYSADTGLTQTLPQDYVQTILAAKDKEGLKGVDNLSPKLSVKLDIDGRAYTLTGIWAKDEYASKAGWSGGMFTAPSSCVTSRKSLLDYTEAEKFRRTPIESLSPTECLIGVEFAEAFGLKEGSPVPLMGRTFTVKRIIPETGTIDDSRVFAKLSVVQKMTKSGPVISAIEIVGCCNEIADGLVEKLNRLLPDAKVITISQVVATQQATNQLMGSLAVVFLVVIVLVGGASIANYMYANAYERRREIGTLMALGATPGMVMRMFVSKALILGLLGGVLGALIGTALAVVLGPKIAKIPVMPMPGYMAGGVGLSLLLTTVSSILPARRAAKTDPCHSIQEL
jgi:putative ABC transport system permease protein